MHANVSAVLAPTESTLADMMLRGAEKNSSSLLAFAGPDRVREGTVGQIAEDAARVAGALQGLGVEPGNTVAVQLPAGYDGAVAQAAVALTGASLLPVVMIYGSRELNFILRQSQAVALFVPTTFRGRSHLAVLEELVDQPHLKTVIAVGDDVPDSMVSYRDLFGRLSHTYRVPTLDPSQRAMLVYTSGTTADPKGVQHSHTSLLAEVRSRVMMVEDDGRHLAAFPPGHVAGLLGLLRVLLLGTPTVALETWDPARAAALIDEYRLTGGVGAPIQLAALLDQKENGSASLETLVDFMTGAAAVPPPLIYRADRLGVAAYRCYGSSEHPTISTCVPPDPVQKRAETDGWLIGENQVRLIDDDGNDVPEGHDGEIASRGPELFLGYTDPELNKTAFLPGGWFRTGDVGRWDADGCLTITDRKKDIVIRGGENISSKEVEDVLSAHPAVAEVAVIGYPDERLGERVGAVVVLAPGRSLDLDEVRDHFQQAKVARQKTPEFLDVVSELPRTPAGKIQKHVIRARYR